MATPTATLTNGKAIAIRHRVVREGNLLGYVTWAGRFIALVNIREIA